MTWLHLHQRYHWVILFPPALNRLISTVIYCLLDFFALGRTYYKLLEEEFTALPLDVSWVSEKMFFNSRSQLVGEVTRFSGVWLKIKLWYTGYTMVLSSAPWSNQYASFVMLKDLRTRLKLYFTQNGGGWGHSRHFHTGMLHLNSPPLTLSHSKFLKIVPFSHYRYFKKSYPFYIPFCKKLLFSLNCCLKKVPLLGRASP